MRSNKRALIALSFASALHFTSADLSLSSPLLHTDKEDNLSVFFGSSIYTFARKNFPNYRTSSSALPAHVNSLSFAFLLPELKPAWLDPQQMDAPGWNNKVTVLFHSERSFDPIQEILSRDMKRAKLPPVTTIPEVGKCASYHGSFVTTDDLRFCNANGHLFLSECGGQFKWETYHSCVIYDSLPDNAIAIVTFGKEHADEMIRIEEFVYKYLPSHKL